jgi:hypothetical protein
MRSASPMAVGIMGAAGAPNHRLPPIKHQVLKSVRADSANPMVKYTRSGLTSSGTSVVDSTGELWPGQLNHSRLSGFTNNGGSFGITLPETWDLTGNYVRFSARVNNYTRGRFAYIIFAETKAAAIANNYLRWKIGVSPSASAIPNWYPADTWVRDSVAAPFLEAAGTGADITKIGFIGLLIAETSTSSPVIWDVGQFELIKMVGAKAKVVIWHDDTVPAGAEAMYAKMQAYGFVGNEATEWETIPNLTGANGAFDQAKYRAAGWNLSTHAVIAAEHTDVPGESVINQALRSKYQDFRFDNKGLYGDFAWWGGLRAPMGFPVVKRIYRSGRWNTSGNSYPDFQPPAEPALMRCLLTATGETFTTNWLPLLQNAIAVKGIAQYCFHQDVSSNTAFAAEFDALLSWLDQHRADIDVVTIPQALAASVATFASATPAVVEDPTDAGTYYGSALVEDSTDAGTFVANSSMQEDSSDPGTFLLS